MPKNTEKELLKDRFGAYVKVSILHVRKKYMTKLENIVLHEIKLEEIDFIEDEEQMPEIALFSEGKFFDEKKMDAREILKYIENPVLYSAVSALKTEQLKILTLRFIYNKSFPEMGKILGTDTEKVKARYFYIIAKLHKIIGE